MREANVIRKTKETQVEVALNLDGSGKSNISTGIGFFDHMLTLFSFYSQIDVTLIANGDLEVCDHHTVEDIGITLAEALNKALEDKKGIERYGNARIPMDESLCAVDIDLSGRNYLVYNCELKREYVGTLSCEMVKEFLYAFASNAKLTLHVNVLYGDNDHHKIEAIFKALGKSLKQAVQITSDRITSTKGVL